jgi:hypothetical protein
MLPSNPFSKSVPYGFRASTTTQEEAKPTVRSPRHRKELSPTRTATLIRSPMHDCQQINPENTQVKIIQRVWNTYFRFQVASVFACHTWRGTTRFNGSVAHCDCQAAHSALAPTLYDDKLRRVTSTILEEGFDALTPTSEKYICHRFELTTPQKEELSDIGGSAKSLQTLIQQLTVPQKKGSFVDTEMEKGRNATFQNPPGSNRLDTHLESQLRPMEDQLAEACQKHEKTPVVATLELVEKHAQLLEEAIVNSKRRSVELEQFLHAHEALTKDQEAINALAPDNVTRLHCKGFIDKAIAFLEVKNQLTAHLSGAPHLNDFVKFFVKKTPYYTLRELCKEFDAVPEDVFLESLLKELPIIQFTPITQDVDSKRADIRNRFEEAQIQLDELRNIQMHIPSFDYLFFGIVEDNGFRRAPTKSEIADALIQETHTINRKEVSKKLSYSDDSTDE